MLFGQYKNHLADISGREVDSSPLRVYLPGEVTWTLNVFLPYIYTILRV